MNAPFTLLNPFTLDRKFTLDSGPVYLNGMQALLRLMLDQRRHDQRSGLNTAGFVCGYPGSPVGGVDAEMSRNQTLLNQHHIVHQPGLNEELAATAAFGTQTLHEVPGARYDGVFAMWFGKAPGVDRSGDAFHHHNFRGTARNGGVLVVAGDDPHARSTIFPSDSNTAFYKFFMPVLAPGNIQDVLDFGLHGYALSRASGLWVGFKFVTDVADSAALAWVGQERVVPFIPEVAYDGAILHSTMRPNEAGPPLIEGERRIVHGQLEIARRYAAANHLNRIMVQPAKARLGLIAGGKTYFDLRQALLDLGLDDDALHDMGISILKMGMLYPVEPNIILEFTQDLEEVFVIEDKRPFLELFIKEILYNSPHRPRIVGKTDETGQQLLPSHGELSADAIARALLRRLGDRLQNRQAVARRQMFTAPKQATAALSTARTPYFCSGCPHNTSLKLPDGAIVGAGIGCHIMALWMGPGHGEVKGYTQMGGEGAQWVGLSPFTDTNHFFQNLGDGTFAHSGSLAIRFATSTNTNVTYKLLYNSAVAMTGGQNILGGMTVPNMVKMLEAEGVRRIIITTDEPERYPTAKVGGADVWHRDRLLEAETELAHTAGVTVLLHDQQCATEKRRLRKRGKLAYKPRSAFINQRVCEGCGDCGVKSNCLSVQPVDTEFGRKTRIHQSSCNQDQSCLKGDCPSFATVESIDAPRQKINPRRTSFPIGVALSDPKPIVPPNLFSVCLMGIGGTGVVTVNQVLGTAAFLSGLNVQTYDHTGSSQKAGPVISHLKVLPAGVESSPTVGTASADLYLVFDPLVGVSAQNIALTSPERSVAVVSTTKVPTGDMVANKSRQYPAIGQLRATIDASTRSADNIYIDAQQIAEALLGDHMASNLLLVGVAFQTGALPIPATAIEEAIRLNGTAIEMNIEAFRWGRLLVADRKRVDAAMPADTSAAQKPRAMTAEARDLVARVDSQGELLAALERRVPELIAFQNASLAAEYVNMIRRVRMIEKDRVGDMAGLSVAVAKNLYKLMAYKDEYEVARLLLDEDQQADIKNAFGPGAKVLWHLHPTFLRKLGIRKKVALGSWFTPVLRVLRWAKWLRGTPLDLPGRARVRIVERALVTHYKALAESLCSRLTAANYGEVMQIAALPDMIRGYEDVKLHNVERYAAEVKVRCAGLGIDVSMVGLPAGLPLPDTLRHAA